MSDEHDKASYNATPLTEQERQQFEQRLIEQSKGETVKPFWVAKADADSVKQWDRFYKRNQANFFKDRHYLTDEFAALTEIIRSSRNPSNHRPISIMEIGCGVGNALFPLVDALSSMLVSSADSSNGEFATGSPPLAHLTAHAPHISLYGCDCSKNAIALCEQRKTEYLANQLTSASTTATLEQSRNNQAGLVVESIDFWVQDIVTEDFPKSINQLIDYGTLIFVLSALKAEDHPIVLKRVASILSPKGRIFIRDYCEFDFAQLRFQSSNKLGESFYLRADGTRSYFFKLDELVDLVKNAGLAIESATIIEKEVLNRKLGAKMRRRFVQVVGRKPND